MKTKKKPYDKSTPEAKALMDEIVHGTFVREGTMVAFPTCFPGASAPIRADESHITALTVDSSGIVYGGTSGCLTHLFVGMFHGVTGMVLDMGSVEGADHCAAVCCGRDQFVACVNGPAGGRVISRAFEKLPFDLLQEWGFSRTPFLDLGEPAPGERIVHAVAHPTRTRAVGITEGHLFVVDIEKEKMKTVAEIRGAGRLAVASKGSVVGFDDDALWRYDPDSDTLDRKTQPLPQKDSWNPATVRWARDPRSGLLYVAEDTGRIFSFSEEEGFRGPLAQTPLAPPGSMAVTFDGRLFGVCGKEISRMFCYRPANGELRDLGAAVSVIERRRYGYVFGDAVVGREGEIIFGEDDDLGHVWLYFPRIEPASE